MPNLIYPKDRKENLCFRKFILEKASSDLDFKKNLINQCHQSRLYFFNVFLYTFDVRTELKHLPFITYPFQDSLILRDANNSFTGEDELIEKTRDMGATWCLAANDIYDWLFSPLKIEIQWGSRKEQYVDTRGDMKTIFEKLRYMVDNLPHWLLPIGYRKKEHDLTMRLINPETGSCIVGEATNPEFGRGDRKLKIRFDEFAFWDCDGAAWEASADTTKNRTAISTPDGSANKFAQLAKDKRVKIDKITLHWSLHPEKAKGLYYFDGEGKKIPLDSKAGFRLWKSGKKVRSPWYDSECERRTEGGVAQELDIDYLKSGRPFFSLVALKKQKEWEFWKRPTPFSSMKYGFFIKGKIVEVDGKYKFIENDVDDWLRIFEMPLDYLEYVNAGDTAEGLAKGDESFAVVRCKYTKNVVATCSGLYPPEDFARKMFLIGKFYNDALDAPENNAGYSVCRDLELYGANLYYTLREETPGGVIETRKRGYTTSGPSRKMMLDQGEEEIRKGYAEVRDGIILGQMETFIHNKKTGKPEADGQFLDDGVLAFVIAGQVIETNPYKPRNTHDSSGRAEAHRRKGAMKNGGYKF